LGVDVNKLNSWERVSKNASPEDPGYVCRETEKASNIQSVRHLLNIKPGQNITPQMLKPYINGEKNDTNIDWLFYRIFTSTDSNLLLAIECKK
jgi:3-deoxy-D-manno-octulosonic acid (KDO) 8-phosphate synthase